MGLFGFRMTYKDWENMNRFGYGGSEEKARTNSMNSVMSSFSIWHLKKVARQTQFFEVRCAAQSRIDELKRLSRRERKQKENEFISAREEREKRSTQQKEQFDKAAEDKNRPEHWLKRLYKEYARENSVGRDQIESGLLSFGDAVYPLVRQYVFTLAQEYHDYTKKIHEISYGTDQGRRTGAVVEAYSEALGHGIRFLARFTHPDRVKDIDVFYRFIQGNIYSHAEGGFSDMFHAVKVRENAVRAMGKAETDHAKTAPFYTEVLQDPCRFVRWVAIDTLKEQWTPEEIKADPSLYQALLKAYGHEDNGTSNRRAKCAFLLGKD